MVLSPDELDLREIGHQSSLGAKCQRASFGPLVSSSFVSSQSRIVSVLLAMASCFKRTTVFAKSSSDGVSHTIPNNEGKPLSYIVETVGTDMASPFADDITSCLAPGSSFIP